MSFSCLPPSLTRHTVLCLASLSLVSGTWYHFPFTILISSIHSFIHSFFHFHPIQPSLFIIPSHLSTLLILFILSHIHRLPPTTSNNYTYHSLIQASLYRVSLLGTPLPLATAKETRITRLTRIFCRVSPPFFPPAHPIWRAIPYPTIYSLRLRKARLLPIASVQKRVLTTLSFPFSCKKGRGIYRRSHDPPLVVTSKVHCNRACRSIVPRSYWHSQRYDKIIQRINSRSGTPKLPLDTRNTLRNRG